jgi:hypothetical protein
MRQLVAIEPCVCVYVCAQCTIQIKHFGAWKAGHFSSGGAQPDTEMAADRAELGWPIGFHTHTHIPTQSAVVGATQLLLSITGESAGRANGTPAGRAAQSARVPTDTTKRGTMSESNCVCTSSICSMNERMAAIHTKNTYTHTEAHTNTEMGNYMYSLTYLMVALNNYRLKRRRSRHSVYVVRLKWIQFFWCFCLPQSEYYNT